MFKITVPNSLALHPEFCCYFHNFYDINYHISNYSFLESKYLFSIKLKRLLINNKPARVGFIIYQKPSC